MAGDIQLTCSDCGQDFTFTAADQSFYQERGYKQIEVLSDYYAHGLDAWLMAKQL